MINKQGDVNSDIGSIEYLPIEYWENDYDEKIDVYSYGLILNVIFTNKQHNLNRATMEVSFDHKTQYFYDIVDNAIQHKSQRKTAK